MDEVKADGGDLFGALVKRKVSSQSTLYNAVNLFNLSLPVLEDMKPCEIFSKDNQHNHELQSRFIEIDRAYHVNNPLAAKKDVIVDSGHRSSDLPTVRNDALCMENIATETSSCEQKEDSHLRAHFSLTSKQAFSRATQSNFGRVTLESTLIAATIFALQGVATDIYNMKRLPPHVHLLGRTGLSVGNFMREARSVFVIRALIDCACTAYCHLTADAGSSALGAQITSLLHMVDASLSQLSTALSAGVTKVVETMVENGKQQMAQPSLVTVWESTLLHRTLIMHLFSIIRPPELARTMSSYSLFVCDGKGEVNAVIERYLRPSFWAQLAGGWSLLHQLMSQLQAIRTSVWASKPEPIFQLVLFRNEHESRAAFDRITKTSGGVVADYACMILTGALARQVSAPLLMELSQKLYNLDADFHQAGRITQAELADSLLISVESLWQSFSLDATNASESDNQTAISAESCIEFLLCALVWARGRIDLMLTESSELAGNTVSADMKRNPALLHRADRWKNLHPVSAEGDFGRQALIQAFRAIAPELLLPMNDRDESVLAGVRSASEALRCRLSESLGVQMVKWYQWYATLSDYYNENAVSAKSLFAKAEDHRLRRDVRADAEALVSFRKKTTEDDLAQQKAARQTINTSALDSGEVVSVGPLNTPHTVPKDLIEKAKDQIRAKYDTLIKSAEERSAAAAWENRRLESLPQARSDLARLLEQDEVELQKLRVLKEQDAVQYMKHFEKLASDPGQGTQVPQGQSLAPPQAQKKTTPAPVGSKPDLHVIVPPPASELPNAETREVHVDHGGQTAAHRSPSVALSGQQAVDGDGLHTVGVASPTMYESLPVTKDVAGNAHVSTKAEEVTSSAPDFAIVEPTTTPPKALQPAQGSHLLVDLAGPMLTPDTEYLDNEERVYSILQSLSSTVLLLGQANGIATDQTGQSESAQAGRNDSVHSSTTTLHSLHSVFMRSLGRAVLVQCRAINLASAQCLINQPVDLLGHIKVVDNLLLVSPNSDFLMSLCTLMVGNHLQQVRVLRRQRTVDGLSPQLSKLSNACMWNDESLQLGFASALTGASAANEWKSYGAQYAALNIDTALPAMDLAAPSFHDGISSSPALSIAEHTASWVRGLFSADGLERLYACYDAPWPVPTIVSRQVLNKFAPITQRFLELGHLVALFRVVWGELRYSRVLLSGAGTRKSKADKTIPAAERAPVQEQQQRRDLLAAQRHRTDRQVSDAMRLVQQTVQSLFDHLSERVYVHQACFKQAMCRVSTDGLDGIVHALNTYADSLAASSLQLTNEEVVLRQLLGQRVVVDAVASQDPMLELKLRINCILDSCRSILQASLMINDANNDISHSDTVVEEQGEFGSCMIDDLVAQLHRDSALIKERRRKLIHSAELCSKFAKHHADLESLIKRFDS